LKKKKSPEAFGNKILKEKKSPEASGKGVLEEIKFAYASGFHKKSPQNISVSFFDS